MGPNEWARRNKRDLVRQIVGTIKEGDGIQKPIAVFMAGLPGAGKTEFLDRLSDEATNFVRIDLDKIVAMFPDYTPESYYVYRNAASIIVDEAVIYSRRRNLNFILDGTFATSHAADNIEHALKRHTVRVFYVSKEATEAWQQTKDREVVTKRGVDKAGFIETYDKVLENLKVVRSRHGDTIDFWLIRKSPMSTAFEVTKNERLIEESLRKQYTKDDLERILS